MFFRISMISAILLFFTVSCSTFPESPDQVQKNQIAVDLPVIRQKLKNRTRDRAAEERFLRIWIRKQKELKRIPAVFSPDNGMEIERFHNKYFWGAQNDSFFSLPEKLVFMEKKSVSHNISALLALRDRFREHRIQLFILLVPNAEQIAARVLVPQFDSSGSVSALQCAATLLEFGLEAIYTDDSVMEQLPFSEQLFCYPDPRPEAALWKILAGITVDRLSRFGKDHFTESEDVHFSERRGPTSFGRNYRWPAGVPCGEHKSGETVESLQVFRNGVPFLPDPKSKILVIGGEYLNLPGPGHTFSGLLSKALRYSADELVLPGKGWIHDLPDVLRRQPDRYLTGKQAAVLVISPQTLADHFLPDWNQLEAVEQQLKKQKPVHRFRLKYPSDSLILPSAVPADRDHARKIRWNREWKSAAEGKTATLVRIKEPDLPQDFLTLDIPEKLRSKPMTLVLDLAVYPEQTVVLSVNGQEVPLPVSSDRIDFRNIAVALEPGTAKAVLKFTGGRDNLILIREIKLHQ